MPIPAGAGRRVFLVFSAGGFIYFGALVALGLTSRPLVGIDSHSLLIALIAAGPAMSMAGGLFIRKWSQVVSSELAYFDDLTGLANRRAFVTRTIGALEGAKAGSIGLVLFDIDGLKRLNDNCGYQAGDELIVNAARLLRSRAQEASAVYRIGGDEFALVVDRSEGGRLAAIMLSLGTPEVEFETCGHLHRVSLSYGFASCREDESFDILFRRADLRLYESKVRLYAPATRPRRRPGEVAGRERRVRAGGPNLELVHSARR